MSPQAMMVYATLNKMDQSMASARMMIIVILNVTILDKHVIEIVIVTRVVLTLVQPVDKHMVLNITIGATHPII
jgi:hypothetical protein